MPLLPLALLALAVLLGLFALFDWRPFEDRPAPPEPFKIEAMAPAPGARASRTPVAGRIEASGKLTILSAPASAGQAAPWSSGRAQWGTRPQRFKPVPSNMLSGLRALFRLVPQPELADRLIIVSESLSYGGGRLLLIDGCFRLHKADGPIAIFPPGTILGLRNNYLMVGPPGLPPELSARVGEHVAWADAVKRPFGQSSLDRVARLCGKGPVEYAVPGSASVQQSASDALAASSFSDRYGVPWADALKRVRRCREKLQQSLPGQGRDIPMVQNMCGSTPPSPVAHQSTCPNGTTLSGGLCRTPEGYVRPIPNL
jgi:hypothetical protein